MANAAGPSPEGKLRDVVNGYWISEPLHELLEQTGIMPVEINAALERVPKSAPMVLRSSHPFLRRIRAATGINVAMISRKHRRLTIWIEQIVDGRVAWVYREHSRNDCKMILRGVIPVGIQLVLIGEPLGKLIDLTPALSRAVIEEIAELPGAAFDVKIAPAWRPF